MFSDIKQLRYVDLFFELFPLDPELPNTGPTNEGAASPSGGKDDIAHIGSICMVYKHLHLANSLWFMQVNIPYMDCLGWVD